MEELWGQTEVLPGFQDKMMYHVLSLSLCVACQYSLNFD